LYQNSLSYYTTLGPLIIIIGFTLVTILHPFFLIAFSNAIILFRDTEEAEERERLKRGNEGK